ncbi:MAG TPA: DUF502 domain-containing protein [Planctomycetota bacterium]|nr:DUF502 domain-containing protein [Planctomycetota bacterium]
MFRKLLRSLRAFLRANFLAGFFLAVPFTITIALLAWVWGKIHGPLKTIFKYTVTAEEMPWSDIGTAIQDNDFSMLIVPMISLALVLGAVLFLGIIARSIIGRMFLLSLEGFVTRIPLVGMLYSSLKQLGDAFLSDDGTSKFQKAVAVQFPYKGVWALGFVTGNAAPIQAHMKNTEPEKRKILTIFVPTTPLPTQGFMLMVPEEETRELTLSVQDALKLVVSGGMIGAGESHRFRPVTGETIPVRVPERETNLKLNEPGSANSPSGSGA